MDYLSGVKSALGIVGEYQDATLTEYINTVIAFLSDCGIQNAPQDIVTRGVADLWNFGAGSGTLSEYFKMRVVQLSYKR